MYHKQILSRQPVAAQHLAAQPRPGDVVGNAAARLVAEWRADSGLGMTDAAKHSHEDGGTVASRGENLLKSLCHRLQALRSLHATKDRKGRTL